MSSAELFQQSFLDISYDAQEPLLYVNWKGYQSVSSIQQGCEQILELMVKHDAYLVLNDNTHVLGIWTGAAEWGATNWFPRMLKAGLQRFAWVYSPSRLSQVSTDTTLSMMTKTPENIRVFHARNEAIEWLRQAVPVPPRDSTLTKKPPLLQRRIRVLVIEDNRDFSFLFREMLNIMGCEPNAAFNAREGLELAQKILPDIIFCDIGLPGAMNGFDFACALRADSELSEIPLIAVSGYTRVQDRERALAAGFDRVFPKPVKFADVSDALAAFSNGKLLNR